MAEENSLNSVELATELTIAWLQNQNNRVSAEDVPAFLEAMHATIEKLSGNTQTRTDSEPGEDTATTYTPAVSVRKSLGSRDHIISMIDGKPYRALRRHLSSNGLTPEQYRERYNLKPDYPMVAPAYSEARREMAHKIGLGSKGRAARAAAAPTEGAAAKPKRTPRKRTE